MAITIIEKPQYLAPIYNGMRYIVNSTNVAQPGFQYLFLTVFFNRVSPGNLKQTYHRISPRPSDGYGVFDPSSIIQSLCSHDNFSDLDSNFIRNEYGYCPTTIVYGESYKVGGVQTDFQTVLNTDTSIIAYSGALDYLEHLNYDYLDFNLEDSSRRFITNAPQGQSIGITERAWLYSYTSNYVDYDLRRVKTYDASGTLLNTYDTNNTFNTTATFFDQIFNFGIRTTVGPAQLSDYGVSFVGVAYYTVAAHKSDGTQISEAKRFDLVDRCSKYEPIRIHFLNAYGGFDSFTFNKASYKEEDIKRTSYTASQYGTVGVAERVKTTSSVTSSTKLKVNSDWLTEAEHKWLGELIKSPIIFQEIENKMIPINCIEAKHKEEKKSNNKVFNITIDFEYTYQNNRQRY